MKREVILLALALAASAHAQRQPEKLGRGLVALRNSGTQVYVGWRLLANDPEEIGFNVYRVTGTSTNKLNTSAITNTTDYVDATANLSVTNSYFVRCVTNGFEFAPSLPFTVPANQAVPVDFQGKVGPYVAIPLQPLTDAVYTVAHAWPGDLDGDGEFDYVVTRLPDTTAATQKVEAYRRDGTLLWRVDLGPNSQNTDNIEPGASAVSVGQADHVTVFDMDGDGKAEVLVKTANGVILGDNSVVTTNNNTSEFISVLDGVTGAEKARAVVPNPFFSDGPLAGNFGILYCDGVHPSLVFAGKNRVGSGAFNVIITAWDWRNGQLVQRWSWIKPSTGNYAQGHQIRIADVNNDGKDDLVEIGYALDGDTGQPLFDTELIHGDRYHTSDLDPDRPGLETYVVQQDNLTFLSTALYDAGTGTMIKKWFASGLVDNGRGNAGDVDPNVRGVEVWSTQPNLYSCTGDFVDSNHPNVNFSIWWDADLVRETLDTGRVDKWIGGRIFSPYSVDNYSPIILTRNAQPLYGDLFGDWREEILFESGDHSKLMIFTPVSPSTTRLVTFLQDPEYRECLTVKGYMQTTWPSYYVGPDMAAPPPSPYTDAKLTWRGGGANVWDAGITANWQTNGSATVYTDGDTVLFDLTGSNNVPVNITGTLAPGAVTVFAPKDYVFTNGTLAGPMKLTKAGRGKLTLANVNTFTGRTLVGEGPLIVHGTLENSPVVVRGGPWLDGRLGGNGSVGAGVTVEAGGGLSPGNGVGSPGTLTITNGLTLRGRTRSDFDIGDLVQVVGNLALQGTNTINITGSLTPGTYTLITYTGTLSGGLSNLVVAGQPGVPVSLANPPGAIQLVVQSPRAPTTSTWIGGNGGNAWDLMSTTNWTAGVFAPLDNVRFDNTGSPTVNLVGSVNPASVVVDSAGSYTFNGPGAIVGSGSLTKTNSGTLTINATGNTYTGPTAIRGGTLAIFDVDVAGQPSSIGAANASPTNLVMSGGTMKFIGYGGYTDRGITLAAGTNTLDVSTISLPVTLGGPIVGGGILRKGGSGQLSITGSNTFTGGAILNAGTVQLGTEAGNTYGLGTGTVTLDGGVLAMLNATGSDYDGIYFVGPWNLNVPTGASGELRLAGRGTITGSLSGGGTLTVWIPFVRMHFNGNWSAFTGRINITGAEFRVNNTAGYGNAHVDLGDGVLMYSRTTSGATIPVGALSGSTGAVVSAGFGSGLGAQNAVTWRVGTRNTDATFAGVIEGTTILVKTGTGTWTLTGTNTHSGATTVSNGTLVVNGILTASPVTVAPAGALAGNGTISNAATINGALAPGASVGTLNFGNNLVVNSSAVLNYELGASNDLTAVAGNLTLGGTLNVTNAGGFGAGNYTLFTYGGTLTYNGLSIGSAPAGFTYSINTNTAGQVRLVVNSSSGIPGLVARYELEGNALDTSGRGNDGTPSNVTYASGRVGALAAQFNGSNAYVQIPRSISTNFSIAFWVKTTDTGPAGQWWAGKGLVDGEVAGSTADFGTALVGAKFAFGIGNPDTTLLSATSINDGAWHHCVAMRDGTTGTIKVYVDGYLEATTNAATAARTAPPSLRIGSIQTGAAGKFLNGVMDEVRLYDYVLGGTEVIALAEVPPFRQWQMAYFGCSDCPQAAGDFDADGDGMSNTNEFLAGTNPTSSLSGLRIVSLTPQADDIVITWQTAGGKTNRVQATGGGEYNTNFTDISPAIVMTGSGDVTTNWTDSGGATNGPSRYYRVRWVP